MLGDPKHKRGIRAKLERQVLRDPKVKREIKEIPEPLDLLVQMERMELRGQQVLRAPKARREIKEMPAPQELKVFRERQVLKVQRGPQAPQELQATLVE